jgi:hypothetical protein
MWFQKLTEWQGTIPFWVLAIIHSDILEGCTTSICRVTELIQVAAEPVQSIKRGKVVPLHAMKAHRWKRGTLTHILYCGARRR